MSAIHGKNTFVEIDDATGAPVALSTFLKSTNADKSFDTAESSTFMQPQGAKTYVLGMNDEKVTIEGNFDIALHTHMVALMNALNDGTLASATVSVGPAGNGTGKPKVSRECFVTKYSWSASTSDVVTVSIELQRTGPSTDGVF